jgi:hypothetical protein
MAKTVPATYTLLDPNAIRPGRVAEAAPLQVLIRDAHFVYARSVRQALVHFDAREFGLGDGIEQGVGSTADTTTGSYVERLRPYYESHAIPANHNLIKVTTVAEAVTANGEVRVQFHKVGFGVVDTVTHSLTAGAGDTRQTTTLSGAAMTNDAEYYVIVALQAAATGTTRLKTLDIDEINIPVGSMP